jgi:hypothetical protein
VPAEVVPEGHNRRGQYQRLDEDHEHMHRTECSASRH